MADADIIELEGGINFVRGSDCEGPARGKNHGFAALPPAREKFPPPAGYDISFDNHELPLECRQKGKDLRCCLIVQTSTGSFYYKGDEDTDADTIIGEVLHPGNRQFNLFRRRKCWVCRDKMWGIPDA
jgi:hypothetical protein